MSGKNLPNQNKTKQKREEFNFQKTKLTILPTVNKTKF